jgi:hypothetical protein
MRRRIDKPGKIPLFFFKWISFRLKDKEKEGSDEKDNENWEDEESVYI